MTQGQKGIAIRSGQSTAGRLQLRAMGKGPRIAQGLPSLDRESNVENKWGPGLDARS